MNKKRKVQILGVLIMLLVAGIVSLTLWISAAKKSVTIYDFARTIQYDEKSNYALTSADIVAVEVLAADVKEDYVTNPNEVVGKYITGTAYKGQHIVKHQVQTDPTYVKVSGLSELAEYRKIYLPINYATGFAGDIKSGQSVDLMFTETGSGASDDRTSGLIGSEFGVKYGHTRIFMQNIPVYQVYTEDGNVYTRKTTDPETLNRFQGQNASALQGQNGKTASTVGPAYVALTVTAKQYEEISARMLYGTVSLVSRFEGSEDQDTDGYLVVKDGYANIFAGPGNLEYDHGVAEMLGDPVAKDKADGQRPGIHSFLQRLAMVNMDGTQASAYNSIYNRYTEFMVRAVGTDWKSNSPDSVTDSDILASIQSNNVDMLNRYLTWKMDVETLAKELMGNNVILPW